MNLSRSCQKYSDLILPLHNFQTKCKILEHRKCQSDLKNVILTSIFVQSHHSTLLVAYVHQYHHSTLSSAYSYTRRIARVLSSSNSKEGDHSNAANDVSIFFQKRLLRISVRHHHSRCRELLQKTSDTIFELCGSSQELYYHTSEEFMQTTPNDTFYNRRCRTRGSSSVGYSFYRHDSLVLL